MASGPSLREPAGTAGRETRAQRLYWEDVWSWSREQADALRHRDIGAIDWENVIEEIEDVSNRHSDAWTSRCTNVISHLLDIEHSGQTQDLRHRREEVEGWRDQMFRKLRDHAGMKGKLSEMLAKAWRDGRKDAVGELVKHGDPVDWASEKAPRRSWRVRLPVDCPYVVEEIAGDDPHERDAEPRDDVWPAPVARRLNEGLGADYLVRFRAPERQSGRSR